MSILDDFSQLTLDESKAQKWMRIKKFTLYFASLDFGIRAAIIAFFFISSSLPKEQILEAIVSLELVIAGPMLSGIIMTAALIRYTMQVQNIPTTIGSSIISSLAMGFGNIIFRAFIVFSPGMLFKAIAIQYVGMEEATVNDIVFNPFLIIIASILSDIIFCFILITSVVFGKNRHNFK